MPPASSFSPRGTPSWRVPRFGGLFFDEFASDSAWIREEAFLQLPPCEGVSELVLRGEFRPHPEARRIESTAPSLSCAVDRIAVAHLTQLEPGPFELRLPVPPASAARGPHITLRLGRTGFTNTLAWLGRITGLASLQHY